DLARGQQNVERNDHGTGFEGAVVDEGEIGQVRARQRDAVAGPDASGHQKMGDLVGDHVGDRVVQAQVAEDQAVLLGNRSCTVFQDSGQVEHGFVPLAHMVDNGSRSVLALVFYAT